MYCEIVIGDVLVDQVFGVGQGCCEWCVQCEFVWFGGDQCGGGVIVELQYCQQCFD